MATGTLIRSNQPQVLFVDLAAQYRSIATEVREATDKVIQASDFILGHEVELFEEEFAAYCETKFAVGVDSGTSALELALRAYGIGAGAEVITAANSFIATALAISHAGAKPVLVDVDPDSYTMDVAAMERAITPRTRAIVPVHLFGHPAQMDRIRQSAEQHKLIVIEDACQAHGARYQGRPAGSLGHAAAFSFYPGKNLGAYGDGGMVVTNDGDIAARVKMLRNYGQTEKYHHVLRGYNRRLDTLQAAVLRVKLRYLEKWNTARRWNASLYHKFLEGTGVAPPSEAAGAESAWHLYVIRTERRDELRECFASMRIGAGVHYPIPIHLQPAYRDLGNKKGCFPVTERYAGQILSLPMYAELTSEQIESVAQVVRDFSITRLKSQCASRPSIRRAN